MYDRDPASHLVVGVVGLGHPGRLGRVARHVLGRDRREVVRVHLDAGGDGGPALLHHGRREFLPVDALAVLGGVLQYDEVAARVRAFDEPAADGIGHTWCIDGQGFERGGLVNTFKYKDYLPEGYI